MCRGWYDWVNLRLRWIGRRGCYISRIRTDWRNSYLHNCFAFIFGSRNWKLTTMCKHCIVKRLLKESLSVWARMSCIIRTTGKSSRGNICSIAKQEIVRTWRRWVSVSASITISKYRTHCKTICTNWIHRGFHCAKSLVSNRIPKFLVTFVNGVSQQTTIGTQRSLLTTTSSSTRTSKSSTKSSRTSSSTSSLSKENYILQILSNINRI